MISFTNVHSLRFASADNKSITMRVKFTHLPMEVDFLAMPTDIEAHGQELYQRALAGEFGPVAEYIVPTVDEMERKAMFRVEVAARIERKAVELGFDSVAEAMTYCDEPSVPEYQTKALALRKWRSLVWAWHDEVVAAGKDVAAFESMPKFEL